MINFPPEARKALGVEADALDRLIADLEQAVGVYHDHMSGEKRTKVSDWCEHFACAWERLVAIAEDAPDGAPAVDLRKLRKQALDERVKAQLLKIKNPRSKPKYPGDMRDYLAQQSKKIIERHCGPLSKPDLRCAVKAILEHVRAKYPNPKNDPTKFDAMLTPRPRRVLNRPDDDFRF
jgi:hypothetical protein